MDSLSRRTDWLFILAAFCASSLIFLIQPIIARELLPTLGGAPAVWTACMLFFQACLLIGYAWAHLGPKLLGDRAHCVIHILLLLSMFAFLPIGLPIDTIASTSSNPALDVLRILGVAIGFPMCILSATSPLLQRWHGAINPERGDRVYRLYSIGNIASLIVLLGYPLIIEPLTTLREQRVGWSVWMGVLAAALIAAAILRVGVRSTPETVIHDDQPTDRFAWIWWIVLSALPSSYLLGVTSYLTSDVAAVPFLWVLPLALYLGAFSIAFAGRSMPAFVRNALAPGLALLCLVLIGAGWTTMSIAATVVLHAGTFFLLTTGCLAELYRRRPPQTGLTRFYLWIAVGGVIGGIFNSLLAPTLFNSTVEYPIALLLCASLAIRWPQRGPAPQPRDPGTANWLYVSMVLFVLIAGTTYAAHDSRLRFGFNANAVMLCMGVPMILCYIVRKRPIAFAFCTAAMSGTLLAMGVSGRESLEIRRSFFGVHRVSLADENGQTFKELYHGTTLHGRQRFDIATNRVTDSQVPLTYYHPEGPLGNVISAQTPARIAVIGLGVGSIAGYVGAEQSLSYYEIDPVVIDLADRSGHFTYLRDARSRGALVRLVPGDARLTLRTEPERSVDLMVLDAFSGDAIPVHLLTREAFAMYARTLSPTGSLAVHISNHYLDLRQVVANSAAELDATVLIRDESNTPEVERMPGRAASTWVVAMRDPALVQVLRDKGWSALTPDKRTVWTDDYSNLMRVLK